MLRLPLVKTRYRPNEGDSTRLSVIEEEKDAKEKG